MENTTYDPLNWKPSDWQGVIAQPYKIGDNMPISDNYDELDELEPLSWLQYAKANENQKSNDCVAQACVAVLEMLCKGNLPAGVQIDSRPLYEAARREYWPHEKVDAGGLYLWQGFETMKALGYIPPDSERVVAKNWKETHEILKFSPLVQAHLVHEGWEMKHVSSKTGCIDHRPRPTSYSGGHATARAGMGYHAPSDEVFMYGANSWRPWGVNGFFCMTVAEVDEGNLSEPFGVRLSNNFWKWDGIEKYYKQG